MNNLQQVLTAICPGSRCLILTPGRSMHAWSSFVPYALACGCTVIAAPSWQCPVASEAMFKVSEQVGFPGVLNLVHIGTNFHLNNRILSDPRVAGVGFIGSTAVGRQLFELCENWVRGLL